MHTAKGFSLIEVLLSVSIVFFIVTALIGVVIYGRESTALAGTLVRAGFVSDEGLEGARNIRDGAYTNLTAGTNGLTISANQWIFSGSSDGTDGFTRQVAVAPVDSTRATVTSTVTWQQNPQRSGSAVLTTRLTNWRRNNGAAVPIVPETSLDLPGPAQGTEIALYATGSARYAVESRVSSSDQELYVIDVTNPSAPTIAGSVEIGSIVNDVAVVGSYAYLATGDNAKELQVVSLATPSAPTVVGSLNLAGNAGAQTIAASGNSLYIGRASSVQPELYAISIAAPAAPTLLSTLEVGDTVWKVALAQNNSYLYAASGSNASEFIVVDVTSPASIVQVGSIDLAGTSDATAVEPFGAFAGVGRDNGDFYTIDVSTPASPAVAGGPLAIGNKINDLAIGPGDTYMFAGSSAVGAETTVLDIASPASPSVFYSVNLSGNEVKGLVWDAAVNRVYGATTLNTAEFIVIRSP